MSRRRVPWGTVFLGFAALGWLGTCFLVPPDWEIRVWLKAFFDASLVGALADWFAVTALFRKPAGLPLPHTDLLVKKKAELAHALPEFLAGFLSPEHLDPVWKSLDYATVLETHLGPNLWKQWERDETTHAWGQHVLRGALDLLQRELKAHQDDLVDPVTELIKKNSGWKGLFVGREAVAEVLEGLVAELALVRDQEHHPLRPALLGALKEAMARWSTASPPWGTGPDQRRQFNQQAADLVALVWQRSEATERLSQALTYVLLQTDARLLSERIRDAVSGDLQAIRVNGALVGGLAGVLLQVVSSFMVAK